MARLPGGLAVWRGRRLLGNSPAPRSSGLLLPVGASRHPALHSVVIEATKYADVPPPVSVRLDGAPVVRHHDGELVVGVPLIWGLTADQLRVVLTHELALPASRHPDLVRGLLDARLREPGSDKAAARHAKLLSATASLLAEAEQVRDAAAVTAAGGGLSAVEDAALALLRAATIAEVFTAFAAAEGTRVVDGSAVRIADLHAGWRLRLERWGAPAHDPAGVCAALPDRHPGLAAELRALDPGPLVTLPPEAPGLDELSADEERALAEAVLPDEAPWTRFADLPVDVYLIEVEHQARGYVEAVHAVLGRAPDNRDELAGTLLRRPVDVERARRGLDPVTEDDAQPPAWMGAALLAVVVEYTLLRKGWRREHPLLARRLIGPDGELLDLNELVRRPEELRHHLGATPTA
ncbi:hypothetical protein Drose_33790 [Dactylosporangium roseum]|uniref:Uncharacterized protein n=1 Tax=Dactylosporangium roseum TaxID=47989 RepID=A0ABY5Z4K0_9ACTN|nr:hypothetical protein [Dactylosporangium roseum]UWZ35998.1 hypothetical protein Drose_33790 [Dactylosporangium roseum]